MTTVTQINSRLTFFPTGIVSAANTLIALQEAAAYAWPRIKIMDYASGVGTLSSTTFVYGLSSITTIKDPPGVAAVYVTPADTTTEPQILKRGWRFKSDNGAFSLIFDNVVVTNHNGKTFDVAWQRAPAQPSAVGDTIEIPDDFALNYAAYWYCRLEMAKPSTEKREFRDLVTLYEDRMEKSLKQGYVQQIHPPVGVRQDRRE